MMQALATPFTGIFISLLVFLIGTWLFKASKGFFLFTPLFVGMVLGVLILGIWGNVIGKTTYQVYKTFYTPGGNIIFWFLNPATAAFAIPVYRRRDILKKYWLDIVITVFIGGFLSLFAIHGVAKLVGLSKISQASMMSQAATTAVAMPITKSIGGVPAITAVVCILNAVIIYALAEVLIKVFKLDKVSKIGLGLGLGMAGKTVGTAKAIKLGSVEGAMASVAVVVVAIAMDILVPIYFGLFMK